jgi:hypothetical protein
MLSALRAQVRTLQSRSTQQVQSLSGVVVSARTTQKRCSLCDGPMKVQKTYQHAGKTLEHGSFRVLETVHVCASGCRHPSGVRATERAESVVRGILPNSVVGYDVMVFVGLQRFCQYRQREEIRGDLLQNHGIEVSTGEVSRLAKRFLGYLKALHEERGRQLQAVLANDGGWPLHIDATGEDGRGTLLVAFAGWRRWVLGAWKVPTERAEAIVPHLRTVVDRFGAPCAIMRDMGRGVTKAVDELVEAFGWEIPVLTCHLHFLTDVGKDLLESDYGRLRALFRRFKVRPALRTLARDLGHKLAGNIDEAREGLKVWQEDPQSAQELPRGDAGIASVRAFSQWILDYPSDGQYQDFPFDRPYLDLYDRCVLANRAIASFLAKTSGDRKVDKALRRLQGIVEPVAADIPFSQVAQRLRRRANLFDELRNALRILPRASSRNRSKVRNRPSAGNALEAFQDIREAVDQFCESLMERRPERGPGQDVRAAIDLMMNHIEQYQASLWGHEIPVATGVGMEVRLVDRTNNLLENFFGTMKRGERRRSGRKILTQDLERLPPEAALACNLKQADYVEVLCGSLDLLPEAFAHLDAQRRTSELAGHGKKPFQMEPSSKIVSASLPSEDLVFVRSKAMQNTILSAAKTRRQRKYGSATHKRKATAE